MKKKYLIILLFILIHLNNFSQDSLKKVFVSVQVGGLAQINVDNNERQFFSYCAAIHAGLKTKKNVLLQTGAEYYKVYFYCSAMNDGPGYNENSNYFPELSVNRIFVYLG